MKTNGISKIDNLQLAVYLTSFYPQYKYHGVEKSPTQQVKASFLFDEIPQSIIDNYFNGHFGLLVKQIFSNYYKLKSEAHEVCDVI